MQVRAGAQLALWRARAALWSGQETDAARLARAGLAGIDAQVLARVGPIEQGQLQATLAEALVRADEAGGRAQACPLAATAAAALRERVPDSPDAWLAARIDARCRRIALPTAGDADRRLLAHAGWRQRDDAAMRALRR
jgi:hypothetical protein